MTPASLKRKIPGSGSPSSDLPSSKRKSGLIPSSCSSSSTHSTPRWKLRLFISASSFPVTSEGVQALYSLLKNYGFTRFSVDANETGYYLLFENSPEGTLLAGLCYDKLNKFSLTNAAGESRTLDVQRIVDSEALNVHRWPARPFRDVNCINANIPLSGTAGNSLPLTRPSRSFSASQAVRTASIARNPVPRVQTPRPATTSRNVSQTDCNRLRKSGKAVMSKSSPQTEHNSSPRRERRQRQPGGLEAGQTGPLFNRESARAHPSPCLSPKSYGGNDGAVGAARALPSAASGSISSHSQIHPAPAESVPDVLASTSCSFSENTLHPSIDPDSHATRSDRPHSHPTPKRSSNSPRNSFSHVNSGANEESTSPSVSAFESDHLSASAPTRASESTPAYSFQTSIPSRPFAVSATSPRCSFPLNLTHSTFDIAPDPSTSMNPLSNLSSYPPHFYQNNPDPFLECFVKPVGKRAPDLIDFMVQSADLSSRSSSITQESWVRSDDAFPFKAVRMTVCNSPAPNDVPHGDPMMDGQPPEIPGQSPSRSTYYRPPHLSSMPTYHEMIGLALVGAVEQKLTSTDIRKWTQANFPDAWAFGKQPNLSAILCQHRAFKKEAMNLEDPKPPYFYRLAEDSRDHYVNLAHSLGFPIWQPPDPQEPRTISLASGSLFSSTPTVAVAAATAPAAVPSAPSSTSGSQPGPYPFYDEMDTETTSSLDEPDSKLGYSFFPYTSSGADWLDEYLDVQQSNQFRASAATGGGSCSSGAARRSGMRTRAQDAHARPREAHVRSQDQLVTQRNYVT